MWKTAVIARKELASYWSTTWAFSLLAIFLTATCLAVFGVTGLRPRAAADIRPLFHWMPPSLIFLAAALTMRQWSEEQRTGTLQVLLALPLDLRQAVLGKFLAALSMIAVALVLTLPIPLIAALLGPLAWGPVIGGYLACLLLAGAYTALGLWLSALTDDAVVAFLATALAGGLLYLAGTPAVLALAHPAYTNLLAGIGTGARFANAEHGVLDLRDLVYFGSLFSLFLPLTVCAVEQKRWGDSLLLAGCRGAAAVRLAVTAGGLLALNLLLAPLHSLRWDLRGYDDSAQTLVALSDMQDLAWQSLTCTLILFGLLGVRTAARAWRRREKPLDLCERDAYTESGLIG
jgi:ABC-2 type transport system permease protein